MTKEQKPVKIESKIVGYKVIPEADKTKTDTPVPLVAKKAIKRPFALTGSSYRLKPPLENHALYVTINDVIIDNKLYPYEIFFNSREMANIQWINALTLCISNEFRRCIISNDTLERFLDNLSTTHSPTGGYRRKSHAGKKPKYVNSLVADIAETIKEHIEKIDEGNVLGQESNEELNIKEDSTKTLQACPKCKDTSIVMQGGCETCTSCDYSACG